MAGLALSLILVLWLERRVATWHLGIATFLLLFATLHLLVADRFAALALTTSLAATIGLASKIKYRHLGTDLLAGDLIYLAKDHLRQLFARYTGLALAIFSGFGLLWGAAIGIRAVFDSAPTAIAPRLALFGLSVPVYALVYLASDRRNGFRSQLLGSNRGHISGFIASLFGLGPSRKPSFSDIDADALPLLPARPGGHGDGSRLPHIIMILHESTFDPKQLGLLAKSEFAGFFAPPGSVSGRFNVDVFGGGTVQTEMSVYSGLSSLSFGPHSPFVYHHFANRLRHTLPSILTGLGYQTRLLSSDEPRVTTGDLFYRSIGFQEINYPTLLPPPFDIARWNRDGHDELIYAHAARTLKSDRASGAPQFLSVMTYMNHGSHTRQIFPAGCHRELRAEALAATGSREFAEYMVRLAESVRAYAVFRKDLEDSLGGDPAIIVRYGDHQPSFVSALTKKKPATDPDLHTTFYVIEPVNCSLPSGFAAPPMLDSAFLSTLTMVAARLPLDPVFATRLSLLDECGSGYFRADSPGKRRFHRALVDQGFIDLG